MEQIVIATFPPAPRPRFVHARSNTTARSRPKPERILAGALEREPATIVELLSTDEGADIEFDPDRLGLTAHTPEL